MRHCIGVIFYPLWNCLCPLKLQKNINKTIKYNTLIKRSIWVFMMIKLASKLHFDAKQQTVEEISKTIGKGGYPHLGDVQRYDHFPILFRPFILIQWIHNTNHMYVLCDYAAVETPFDLLCSFKAIKRLFHCELITVGVHEKLNVTRWRFLSKSCPRPVSVTLTGTREKVTG